MKKTLTLSSLLLFFIIGCNEKKEPPKPQDDVDAARKFIRSALDGNYGETKTYLLPDSINIQYLEVAALNYNKLPGDAKLAYKNSTIQVYEVSPVNDSTTVVVYSNSYKNDHDTLKVVKMKGQWLVDFKYLYQHDMDTMQVKPVAGKDSAR